MKSKISGPIQLRQAYTNYINVSTYLVNNIFEDVRHLGCTNLSGKYK